MMELHLDIEGAAGQLRTGSADAASIPGIDRREGSTSETQRNIVGERVLGLPMELRPE